MTRSTLRFIPAAKEDLQEIWSYTVKAWGRAQAKKYVVELKEACHKITVSPFLGKPVPNIGENVRAYRCQQYYIFYSGEKGKVVFLAFMHEKRDILRHVITRLP